MADGSDGPLCMNANSMISICIIGDDSARIHVPILD